MSALLADVHVPFDAQTEKSSPHGGTALVARDARFIVVAQSHVAKTERLNVAGELRVGIVLEERLPEWLECLFGCVGAEADV
jgi:hypothetical protein